MATFKEFLRTERTKRGLNQSEFGQVFGIIMTDISKIENGKKKFPYASLETLADFLEMDYLELKNFYVAEMLVEEAHKYECTDAVFAVAENQSKYVRNKNVKQGKIKF